MVLLVPENDGACTGLNGRTARKTKVLVLVWCNKARGDREQDLWRYRLPEGCIKQRYDKRSGYVCLSKKCELWEQWSSDIAVSCALTKLSNIQSGNTVFETYWLSLLTSISSDAADSSLLPLLFVRSLSSPIINIVVASKIWSCHELDCMEYHPHAGFYYSKLVTYLCHDYSRLINISGINLNGSEYRQVSV